MDKRDKRQSPRSRRRAFAANPNALRAAERGRGRLPFNLWYVYSPRCKKDVILKSDAEFDHFVWLEGDPNVLSYELEPPEFVVTIGTDVHRTRFDALVKLRTGTPQLREVKSVDSDAAARDKREEFQSESQAKVAAAAGFDYVRITRTELKAHRQLIANWRRGVACLAAAREHSLATQRNEIVAALLRHRRATIAQILSGTNPRNEALYLAALFTLLQSAELSSDLDCKPVCSLSCIWLPGEPREKQ